MFSLDLCAETKKCYFLTQFLNNNTNLRWRLLAPNPHFITKNKTPSYTNNSQIFEWRNS